MESAPFRPVRSLERALRLLDFMRMNGGPGLGVSELSRALGLSKAVVFRLLRTLEQYGYVVQEADRRYRLGTKPLELASVVLRQFEVRQVAWPMMLALAERTGESVVLTVPGPDGVICVDTVDSPQQLRVSFRVGRITPWHAGAAGKLHLAFLPKEKIQKILSQGLPRYTERTITDPALLLQELEQIRKQGYAFTIGELDPGVAAITAPIFDARQNVVAAISIGGPASRFTDERLPTLIREVRWAAQEISLRLLGGQLPQWEIAH
ncbi:MAG: IclR family transcriptional regulator [Armatimonadota bacterium]|nr:IclR family transcriptional regulator [Armatimonadota bacterium]MDR7434572.1 IclR family transcriptional regulator [Armatimonadota bacterium]